MNLTFLTFRDHLHLGQSLPSSSSTVCFQSQVGLLQTAHSWANAGVLLGGPAVSSYIGYMLCQDT